MRRDAPLGRAELPGMVLTPPLWRVLTLDSIQIRLNLGAEAQTKILASATPEQESIGKRLAA